MRHLPGAQPAWVEAAAHLTNHVRPALEGKNPALHEGATKSAPVRPSDWIITRSRETAAFLA